MLGKSKVTDDDYTVVDLALDVLLAAAALICVIWI